MPSFVIHDGVLAHVLKNITYIKNTYTSTALFLQAAKATRCATAFFSKFTGIRK